MVEGRHADRKHRDNQAVMFEGVEPRLSTPLSRISVFVSPNSGNLNSDGLKMSSDLQNCHLKRHATGAQLAEEGVRHLSVKLQPGDNPLILEVENVGTSCVWQPARRWTRQKRLAGLQL